MGNGITEFWRRDTAKSILLAKSVSHLNIPETQSRTHYLGSEEVLNKLKGTDELGCSNIGIGAENI